MNYERSPNRNYKKTFNNENSTHQNLCGMQQERCLEINEITLNSSTRKAIST